MPLFKSMFVLSFLFLICSFAGSSQAWAYCVYNKTQYVIEAYQNYGGRMFKSFEKRMWPKTKACCNWKNKDCNMSKKRNAKLGMRLKWAHGTQGWEIFWTGEFEAGGWIEIHKNPNSAPGNPGRPIVKVFPAPSS